MEINSVHNEKIKNWEKLKMKKYRDETGLFIVQQYHMINEAQNKGLIDTLILRNGVKNDFGIEAVTVSDVVMKKLSNNVSLNDVIAVCRKPEFETVKYNRVIVLERIQDPGNLGTIIRTAHGFGYDAVILSEDCCDEYNEKCLQGCQGALFYIPVIRTDLLKELKRLKSDGVRIYATRVDTDNYLQNVKKAERYALVFGNEGKGLSREITLMADESFKIEMAGFEALNVAVAMAVSSYQFVYGKE